MIQTLSKHPDHSANPDFVDVGQAAESAWKIVWAQLLERGEKVINSNPLLHNDNGPPLKIAETPFDVVLKIDKMQLLHYRSTTNRKSATPPLLICYGLIGRQTMIDLQEDRSLVRSLLLADIDVYVIDWGTPTRADQFLNFDDYINDYLLSCVEHVVETNNGDPINLFGICEGGTLASAIVALRPELFSGLALAITPIDFHGNPNSYSIGVGLLNSWLVNMSERDIDQLLEPYGMLPGQMMGAIFSSLTPMASITKYNLDLESLDGDDDAMINFLRMEKWLSDRPDHPGEAARQWLNLFYRKNQLVEGRFEVDGKKVDLTNIACPVLNIYAEHDHIIPVSCTRALSKFIPPERYKEIGFSGGHVGVFVSKKAQGIVAKGIIEWAERLTPSQTKMPA